MLALAFFLSLPQDRITRDSVHNFTVDRPLRVLYMEKGFER
jgi:hypothetical protein